MQVELEPGGTYRVIRGNGEVLATGLRHSQAWAFFDKITGGLETCRVCMGRGTVMEVRQGYAYGSDLYCSETCWKCGGSGVR